MKKITKKKIGELLKTNPKNISVHSIMNLDEKLKLIAIVRENNCETVYLIERTKCALEKVLLCTGDKSEHLNVREILIGKETITFKFFKIKEIWEQKIVVPFR